MVSESRTRVFATTELLEGILMHLDPIILLTLAPPVQRRWRDVIRDSTALQQRLFLRGTLDRSTDGGREPNPLLKNRFPFFFYGPFWKFHASTSEFSCAQDDEGECHARWITSKDFSRLLPWAGSKYQRRDAFLRPEASWRKMLVAQPPIRLVGLVRRPLYDESGGRGGYRTAELDMRRQADHQNLDGLRMGELYEAVAGWVQVPRPGPERIRLVWKPSAAHPLPSLVVSSAHPAPNIALKQADEHSLQALRALADRVDLLLELPEPNIDVGATSEAWKSILYQRAMEEFRPIFLGPESHEKSRSLVTEDTSHMDILDTMRDLLRK
ncbi:hypothetical protein PG984_005651 [Apiospora sp. TS-2023a]